MHGDAANIVAADFALAGVQARTNFDTQRPDVVGNGACTTYASCGAVKRGKDTVAGGLDLVTAEAVEIAPNRSMMIVEQITPAMIAKCSGFLGRPDNVREEDRGKHAIY
jgi:hypothetical protein